MWNEHLGYVLTCPSNLGTGMRAGVHVKIPLVSADKRFDTILEKMRLQKRGAGKNPLFLPMKQVLFHQHIVIMTLCENNAFSMSALCIQLIAERYNNCDVNLEQALLCMVTSIPEC